MRALKWLAIAVGLALLVLGVVMVTGALLPDRHAFTRTVHVTPAVGAVWAVIADQAGQAAWRRDLTRVETLSPDDGRPAYRMHYRGGETLRVVVAAADPPRRLELELRDESTKVFTGVWRLDLAPEGGRTRVSLHEEAGYENPLFRVLARYVTGETRLADAYLQALALRLEDSFKSPQPNDIGTRSKQ